MKPKILFATTNEGKLREARRILAEFEVVSLGDVGITADVPEDGDTFEENALIKARAYFKMTGLPAIADDSGLSVDCLGGFPGVMSARFMEGASYAEKNAEIIRRVNEARNGRTARFVCAAAFKSAETEFVERGEIEGVIAHEPFGGGGFGYDPIFFVEDFGKTTAQMAEDEKNAVSHRGKALKSVAERLTQGEFFVSNVK